MTTFPALIPSGRTFTPGGYPHTAFAGMSGRGTRVRHSNVMLDSQLRLSFLAISEAQMLSILAHYQGQQGQFLSFLLPSDVWSGVNNLADYQLDGYGWIYVEPPQVEDLPCGGHNVTLTLQSVPPEGTALLGADLFMAYSLAAGGIVLESVSGASLSINYSLAAGSVQAAGETDPYFSDVSLLLPMTSTAGFTDLSNYALTVTAYGNAQISTAQSRWGGGSGAFDGSNNTYALVGPDSSQILGTGDFTIEQYFYLTTINQFNILSSNRAPLAQNPNYWALYVESDNRVVFQLRDYDQYYAKTNSNVVSVNTWYHVAAVRKNGVLAIYLEGDKGPVTSNANINLTHNYTCVGAFLFEGFESYSTSNANYFRITKRARYEEGTEANAGKMVYAGTNTLALPTGPFPTS